MAASSGGEGDTSLRQRWTEGPRPPLDLRSCSPPFISPQHMELGPISQSIPALLPLLPLSLHCLWPAILMNP